MKDKKYQIIDINELVNNQGFSFICEYDHGELTHAGTSLPANNLKFNQRIHINGVPFKIIRNQDSKDNIEVEGQSITFPTAFIRKIHFLSLSCYGSYFQELKLLKDKKNVGVAPFFTTDLIMKEPEFDEVSKGIGFDYLHNRKGKTSNMSGMIWYSNIEVNSPLAINEIKFEDNPAIHIFSITIEE